MVGREREAAALEAFLDTAPTQPAALVLAGEAGIGKTTLFRVALEQAVASGFRILAARPAAGEVDLPYAGLADLLSSVADETVAALSTPQRAALGTALRRTGSGGAVDRHALSRGLLDVLRNEARARPVLLAVDDVQWLDRPTAGALTFAIRRLDDAPLHVLVAVRTPAESGADLPLGLAAWNGVRRIDVGPLSTTEVGAVVRQQLGVQLRRPEVEIVARHSGGNPMFAVELARQGRTTEASGMTFSAAVAERLRTLDPDQRAALSYAAAALRPTPELLLGAGLDRKALHAALETGVLKIDGGRVSFEHPLLAASAYDLLLPDERLRIHARLAAASSDVLERGHHVGRSASAPDEPAAKQLDAAAAQAATLGDHALAAHFLLRARELSAAPGGLPAQWRAVGAAVELELAGDVSAAGALAEALVDELPVGPARAKARLLAAYCGAGSPSSYDDLRAGFALALGDASGDAALEAEAHLALAEVSQGTCRLAESLSHSRRAVELAAEAGAEQLASFAYASIGFTECMLGLGVTDAAREAYALWDTNFELGQPYSPRMVLGLVHLHAGAFEDAVRYLTEELELAEERGIEPVAAVARAHLAEVLLRAGRWADSLAVARQALEHARQAVNEQMVTGASYPLAMTYALLGRHDDARELASFALGEAEAMEDFWFTISHRAVLGLVALASEDAQSAVDTLGPAWELMLGRELGDLSIFPVAQVLGEALVAVGRLDDAVAVVEALRTSPVGDAPWPTTMAGRVEALALSAEGRHEPAREAMACALAVSQELSEPFEQMRTVHLSGRIERSARRWGNARSAFAEALDGYDQLGAARWAEHAAADLARLPGRRPADARGLTTREREVAELVAAGLANKEIAARLFVSLSTVESTLSKTYAKLGVRSRTELASRLSREPGNSISAGLPD
jgi:DNA-binding NarL/FixJ family response regulator